jgi:hypothetical protein
VRLAVVEVWDRESQPCVFNEALGLTLATQAGIDENRWAQSACLLGSVERFDNLIGRVAPTPINPTRKA